MEKISYALPPQKVFRDIDHYRLVRASIIKALSPDSEKNNGTKRRCGEPYLLSRLVVNFSTETKEEQIYLDYLRGEVVLEAPMTLRESPESLAERRMNYFGSLLRSVEAMTTIGITHIYLVLNNEGRRKLEIRNRQLSPSKRKT